MIAPGAFFRHPGDRIYKPDGIGAGLDTIGTSHTPFFIHQNKSIRGDKGGAHGAHLNTGGLLAHIAQLGHKKGVPDFFLDIGPGCLVTVQPSVGTVHINLIGKAFDIPFHPGAVVAVGHIVFAFVCHTAGPAPDAPGNIDDKRKLLGVNIIGPISHARNLLRYLKTACPHGIDQVEGAGNSAIQYIFQKGSFLHVRGGIFYLHYPFSISPVICLARLIYLSGA